MSPANRIKGTSFAILTRILLTEGIKGYDFEKEVRDRLKDIPKALKGDIEKSVLGEIGKLAKVYLEGVHELKQANQRAAELTGIENALKMTTQDWLHGRGAHIQEGKPYSVQELKDRMSRPINNRWQVI